MIHLGDEFKIRGTTPVTARKRSPHRLNQAVCHDNGACRDRLLGKPFCDPAPERDFLIFTQRLAPSAVSLKADRKRNNSINAFEKYVLL